MFVRLDISQETADRKAWEDLLAASGLRPDPPYSAVFGIYEEGRLAATGARDRSRLKCVAVDPVYRGSSLFNRLLTGIIAEAFDTDIQKLFLYTKPQAAASFSRVGFRTLAVTPQGITFMERGRPSLSEYLDRLAREQAAQEPAQGPFEAVLADTVQDTATSRKLLAGALSRPSRSYVFYRDDPAALDEGACPWLEAFPQILCHDSQGYLIPLADFPAYFLPDEKERVRTQAWLEASLLGERIAPALGIKRLTLGLDRRDPLQVIYLDTVRQVLDSRLELIVIPLDEGDGALIS